MRCYICNKVLTEPEYNRDHMQWDPCQECLDAIEDAKGAFTDRPSMEDDDMTGQGSFPFDDILHELDSISLDKARGTW